MAFYNDIFVSNYDFDIDCYKEYMFNDFYKQKYMKIEHEPIKQEEIIEETKIEQDVYFPDKSDPLFWCIYIYIYGMKEYNEIQRCYSNASMDEKHKINKFYNENFKKMKAINVKLTNTLIKEIISEMLTNAETNIKILYAYAIYYKKQILITKDDFYLDICPNEHEGDPIVLVKNKKEYGIHLNPNIEKIKNEYFKLETFENPLKSISNYSITELRELAVYFDLKHDKKTNKQTLYRDLCKICEW